jgi:hypothetical protein
MDIDYYNNQEAMSIRLPYSLMKIYEHFYKDFELKKKLKLKNSKWRLNSRWNWIGGEHVFSF